MKPAESTSTAIPAPPTVPGWAIPRGPVTSTVDAACLAGAALNSLDNLVRSDPPWAGVWRQRLALKCAIVAVAQAGRTKDEGQLRDAWHLRATGADPGPAGNILAAWRRSAARSSAIDAPTVRAVVDLLGVRWSEDLAALPERLDELARSGQPAPLVAAAIASEVQALRPMRACSAGGLPTKLWPAGCAGVWPCRCWRCRRAVLRSAPG